MLFKGGDLNFLTFLSYKAFTFFNDNTTLIKIMDCSKYVEIEQGENKQIHSMITKVQKSKFLHYSPSIHL